jgi:ABC-2 type transport system ATP-binding protein
MQIRVGKQNFKATKIAGTLKIPHESKERPPGQKPPHQKKQTPRILTRQKWFIVLVMASLQPPTAFSTNPVRPPTAAGTVVLSSVCKAYGDFVAVDNISLSIKPGTIYGLLGPNGAGKTSTLRMIIGITFPDSGQVSVFGEPLTLAHKDRFGYLPEERGLYKKMKVLEHLLFLAQLKGLSSTEALKRAQSWCNRFDLSAWTGKKVEELSKGMQQKVQFIGAILHDPELIVMDEPFSGLDPASTVVLKNVLLELAKSGKTILLSTHGMDQAERLCHSICLVNHGRAVLEGDLSQIKASYGNSNVQIKYDGDARFLQESRLVQSFNDYGNYVEVKLAPGADTQELLKLASAGARLSKFEVMEPSLEEIFIDAVSKPDPSQSGSRPNA